MIHLLLQIQFQRLHRHYEINLFMLFEKHQIVITINYIQQYFKFEFYTFNIENMFMHTRRNNPTSIVFAWPSGLWIFLLPWSGMAPWFPAGISNTYNHSSFLEVMPVWTSASWKPPLHVTKTYDHNLYPKRYFGFRFFIVSTMSPSDYFDSRNLEEG